MPEGDTVYKLAAYLDAALRGVGVQAVELLPRFGPSGGARRVAGVGCEGKHLYLHFADGTALRSHLGMYGSWHRYRRGAAWRKPARQASLILRTEAEDFVCFNAKEVEWLKSTGFVHADRSSRLGPDLIQAPFDAPVMLARARTCCAPDAPLADVLLDQRIAAGIGNVYKSEVLFLERMAPLDRLGTVPDEALTRLYARAATLLRRNLGGGPRVTRGRPEAVTGRGDRDGGLWVYGRAGLPCLACGAPVTRALLGARPRSTYWCPGCQPAAAP
jgi:endonuclease-8